MAQPSVAREPSMEEILASIRRIIESNDPVSGETFASDADDEAGPTGREVEVDFGYESVEFTPANDPGPPSPAAQPAQRVQAEVQPEASRSVSLADLAARVRSASERTERPVQQMPAAEVSTVSPATAAATAASVGQPAAAPAPAAVVASETPVSRGESPLMTARLAELRAPQLRPSISIEIQPAQTTVVRPQSTPAPQSVQLSQPVRAQAPVEVSVQAPAQVVAPSPVVEPQRREIPEVQPELRHEEPRAPSFDAIAMHLAAGPQPEAPVEDEPRPSTGSDLTALVSAATVEHVSRSFSDLAAAIDGQERRSLDEMAEDMLRPMLKDWLDDNLPTLVERLVREEIERVARGPRR